MYNKLNNIVFVAVYVTRSVLNGIDSSTVDKKQGYTTASLIFKTQDTTLTTYEGERSIIWMAMFRFLKATFLFEMRSVNFYGIITFKTLDCVYVLLINGTLYTFQIIRII